MANAPPYNPFADTVNGPGGYGGLWTRQGGQVQGVLSDAEAAQAAKDAAAAEAAKRAALAEAGAPGNLAAMGDPSGGSFYEDPRFHPGAAAINQGWVPSVFDPIPPDLTALGTGGINQTTTKPDALGQWRNGVPNDGIAGGVQVRQPAVNRFNQTPTVAMPVTMHQMADPSAAIQAGNVQFTPSPPIQSNTAPLPVTMQQTANPADAIQAGAVQFAPSIVQGDQATGLRPRMPFSDRRVKVDRMRALERRFGTR